MTPRMFALLLDRLRDRRRSEDRRAGEVVAMIYNAHCDGKKDPQGRTWLDWFPEWKEAKPVQTEDQMYQAMLSWTAATKGRES